MSDLPLVEGVLKYVKENNISFSMPGHKNGKGFFATEEGKTFINNILSCDITEVEGVDNLHNPEGIIKEASELLTQLYGSKKSYFLVNGSTSGNLIMVYSSFKEGDKVIIDRSCHKSIFNAIILKKLKPVYIKNRVCNSFNAPISINMEHFFQVIKNNRDAKGIILTYPNYYGICCDLEKIIEEAKNYNMKVLIDSAHGAHFGISNKLPKSAVKLGADMVVTSSHKTLASFTQTAFLHINSNINKDKVDFYFSSFSSTSPSYLLMCSMDYGRYYLQKYGRNEYNNLIELAEKYKNKINNIDNMHVIDEQDINENYSYFMDRSRYIINLNNNYNSNLLLKYLRENKIQCEMSDTHNIVLIFSPFNTEEDFKYLYEVLRKCDLSKMKFQSINIHEYSIPVLKLSPHEAVNKPKKKIDIEGSLGRICGENIIPYPPGIPLIMMGEIIDKETIIMLKYYLNNGIELIGVDNGKVKIIE
ncbi:aminotransferase class I/II-fold pyridoxal phosphate-dependent enzyme [Clostridium rectalis]|uniref:aminotransferase class I/II-fold pyridoxal phosphate-dependent enzyme n=1 Tax=Clostridium rectalis TaxID=2040295 RepID=UPI000F62F355|nr:aminotransferase class V-fold PLP-dependent enzyme [Clostridium rectalis]